MASKGEPMTERELGEIRAADGAYTDAVIMYNCDTILPLHRRKLLAEVDRLKAELDELRAGMDRMAEAATNAMNALETFELKHFGTPPSQPPKDSDESP